ncbi:MAG: DNA polymerase III subunit delta' [Clostridiales bacterium]|nr:DNA polymerase III subunit delta' [Clostridiales bacterium]
MNNNGTVLPAMMAYDRINAGLRIVLEQFRRGGANHAYLLTGAMGLGKRTFAKVLASALFCMSPDKPCGVCEACRRVMAGNEPDVLEVYPESGKQIPVDRIREVIRTVSQHAFGSGYRVVIIEPVEKMNAAGQNALLKSLEEPLSNVVFLLLTHEFSATLGTIASRCVRVKLTPWPDELMQQAMQAENYPEEEIRRVLPLSGGNIGTALSLLSGDGEDEDVKSFVDAALSLDCDAAAVAVSTRLKDAREKSDKLLDALERAIHQTLLFKTGMLGADCLKSFPAAWQRISERITPKSLNTMLEAIFEARRMRLGQVNWQSTVDQLMIKLLEEQLVWQQL